MGVIVGVEAWRQRRAVGETTMSSSRLVGVPS
jgi:hypothetical protein